MIRLLRSFAGTAAVGVVASGLFLALRSSSAAPADRVPFRAGVLEDTGRCAGAGGCAAAELRVRLLDVGQGDAILLENGGSRVLVDGGPSAARMGALLDSLRLNGTTLDLVVLTHVHDDHAQGLQELFAARRGITVQRFVDNTDDPDAHSRALRTLRDSVRTRAARGETVYRDADDPCGDGSTVCTFRFAGGARLHLMRPFGGHVEPEDGANNRSVPLKLVGPDSASFSMWLAGDASTAALDWFEGPAGYHLHPGMKVNVLKGNHHGACRGISGGHLERTDPEWVLFSLAARNPWGRMTVQTKTFLARHATPWYRTDQNGTITLLSPGTPGGGYTVAVNAGTASMDGPSDAPSRSSKCRLPR
jgi:competence protein ComEC